MIPMRDGVKLHTVILVPKGAKNAPILLTRTPYNATALTSHAQSSHLGPILEGYDNATDVIVEGGYIRVVQDVRGKYGSEGDYVMNRPLHGPQNPTPVDDSTDTYDTIDWLVKNVPESNGKVGILGISYDGFLPLMALVNPHPALKVAVPMNPMVDGWMGDDWFHNGAFRQQNMPLHLRAGRHARQHASSGGRATTTTTTCSCTPARPASSANERGLDQIGFWNKVVAHPAYDAFWQRPGPGQAPRRTSRSTFPRCWSHSLWDQEDIYGAIAVYKAIKPKDTANDKVFLVHGPLAPRPGDRRRQHRSARSSSAATPALYFRQHVLAPVPRPVSEGRRARRPTSRPSPRSRPAPTSGSSSPRGRPAAPAAAAVKPTPLYLAARPAAQLRRAAAGERRSTSTSPTPPSPCPSARAPSSPSATTTATHLAATGSSTISAKPPAAPTCSPSSPTCSPQPVKIGGQPVAHLSPPPAAPTPTGWSS